MLTKGLSLWVLTASTFRSNISTLQPTEGRSGQRNDQDLTRKQEGCGAVSRLTVSHGSQFQDHVEGAFNVGEIICDRKTGMFLFPKTQVDFCLMANQIVFTKRWTTWLRLGPVPPQEQERRVDSSWSCPHPVGISCGFGFLTHVPVVITAYTIQP